MATIEGTRLLEAIRGRRDRPAPRHYALVERAIPLIEAEECAAIRARVVRLRSAFGLLRRQAVLDAISSPEETDQ